MATHTKEQFQTFLSQLRRTNATLAFYSDFEKISENVENIAISLNTLNYLLGKDNLRKAVEEIWERDKRTFEVMDILIATRKKDKKEYLDDKGETHSIHSLFHSVDGIMKFLDGTGLAEIFRKKEIKNLVDYVFGVETGLDTNSRKNRSGHCAETIVADAMRNSGITFEEQVSSANFPTISDVLGADLKVFDFCVKTTGRTYLIEVNFYSSGGSKLNEVARAYTDVGLKINGVDGYEFVWITDGQGWLSAKSKLEEAFMAIPRIYNLTTISDFFKEIKAE